MATVDWGAVATLFGVLVVVIGGIVHLILTTGRLVQRIEDNTKAIESNGRHLDSIMEAQWKSIWRISTMEDYLEEEHRYRPPRIMPRGPIDNP